MKEAVTLLSGGLDSTTLLYYLKCNGYVPHALSFNYKQRHEKELDSARKVALLAHVKSHKVVDISSISELISKGALTGDDAVPEEHYSHESQKITIVPNRNAILLSLAVGYAIKLGINTVAYAAHYSDRAIYPDCRWEFVDTFQTAMRLANGIQTLTVWAPFINMTKAEIVNMGSKIRVPFEATWSCYKGGEKACGVCGTCRERIEAFQLNRLKDPIQYEVEIQW